MFGKGTDIQGAASENAGRHLLLQLHYDKMLNWIWGDKGFIQFWVSEEGSVAKRWDKVESTMEAH